jgi:ATP-dependent DNA helicase RecG
MRITLDQVSSWMMNKESEHLEFKEAKLSYETDKLTKYCCALANGSSRK